LNLIEELLKDLENDEENFFEQLGKKYHALRKKYSEEEIRRALEVILFALEVSERPILPLFFEEYERTKRVFVEEVSAEDIADFLEGKIGEIELEEKRWY